MKHAFKEQRPASPSSIYPWQQIDSEDFAEHTLQCVKTIDKCNKIITYEYLKELSQIEQPLKLVEVICHSYIALTTAVCGDQMIILGSWKDFQTFIENNEAFLTRMREFKDCADYQIFTVKEIDLLKSKYGKSQEFSFANRPNFKHKASPLLWFFFAGINYVELVEMKQVANRNNRTQEQLDKIKLDLNMKIVPPVAPPQPVFVPAKKSRLDRSLGRSPGRSP